MNLLKIAKGLFIGGVFFVGIFYFMNAQANRASAQAQAERAAAQVAQQAAAQPVEEREIRETALLPPSRHQFPGRFQIVPWDADASYGAYVLDTATGKLYHVVRDGAPSLIGQAQ